MNSRGQEEVESDHRGVSGVDVEWPGVWPGTQVESTHPYTKLMGRDFTGGESLQVGSPSL